MDTQLQISASIPFEFELVAVPDDLAHLINTFFAISTRSSRIDETMPAYSAQLLIYLEGEGELKSQDGSAMKSETVNFTAPLLNAMPFTIKGPAKILGASFTPLGWQCLSDLPADEVNNCTVSADRLLSRDEIAQLERLATGVPQGANTMDAVFAAMGDTLRERKNSLNRDHEKFVATVTAWLSNSLNPSLDALYDNVSVSQRSAQRLCRRYFGVSPSRLVKRFRAIRAAMLLANPDLSEEVRDEIVSVYFDQAHLIRDIRRYTGRTPGGLKEESFLQDTLDPDAHGTPARILR